MSYRIRLLIEYDGSYFHGWQRQPGLMTVHDELRRVLQLVLKEPVSVIHASGRTDTGVHARGQVVCFDSSREVDLQRLTHSVSSLLKNKLSIIEADYVPEDFHPRRSSRAKHYVYTILHRRAPAVLDRGRVWHVTRRLDIEKMQAEARKLVGRHDFSSFRGHSCGARSPIKEIFSSEVEWEPPYLRYRVVGKGFLKQMVRNIVGTLVDLASGRLEASSIEEVLEARDRKKAGVTAPAHGLCLEKVEY